MEYTRVRSGDLGIENLDSWFLSKKAILTEKKVPNLILTAESYWHEVITTNGSNYSGVFSTGALAPVILEQFITVTAL